MKVKRILSYIFRRNPDPGKAYYKRQKRYAFSGKTYKNQQQYEAAITKMYHSVEKGLSYSNYRPGFGKQNIMDLISAMESYAAAYDVTAFFYETALCTLHQYIRKNKEHGHIDPELENRIKLLKGTPNECGGVLEFDAAQDPQKMTFKDFVQSRHSIRTFDKSPVDIDAVKRAISLAQQTPSACNRQGWRCKIVQTPEKIKAILANQNGNKGFGEQIKTLLVVTGDLRYFGKLREKHQVFIDGGMYAMNLLHCLHYEHVATIPLSASLLVNQENNIRSILNMDKAEVLVMFIGLGSYPSRCITTRSERKPPVIEIV